VAIIGLVVDKKYAPGKADYCQVHDQNENDDVAKAFLILVYT
jgi:hypothetical protein